MMTDREYRDRILGLIEEINAALRQDDELAAVLKIRELHRHIYQLPAPQPPPHRVLH